MANVKKALTGEINDLVDPFVQISFAGLTVRIQDLKITSKYVINDNYN